MNRIRFSSYLNSSSSRTTMLKPMNIVKKLAPIILFCILAIVLFSQFALVIVQRNPKELREMTMVKYAIDFSNGINPYSYKVLQQELPVNAGCYGLLVPLIVSPLFWIIPDSYALLTLEILTLAVSIVGLRFFYKTLCVKNASKLLALYASLMLYISYFYWKAPYTMAMPGQWGLTTTMALMYMLATDEEKGKYRPLKYALLIVAAFYIKQYMVLVGLALFIYLLFKSFSDAWKLIGYGLLIGTSSLFIVQLIFPLYFSLAIARAKIDAGMAPWSYAQEQVSLATSGDLWVVSLAALLGLFFFVENLIHKGEEKKIHSIKTLLTEISYGISYEGVAACVLLLPTMYLSLNGGQHVEYLLQLWIPYIICGGTVALRSLLCRIQSGDRALRRLVLLSITAVVAATTYTAARYEFQNPFSESIKISNQKWEEAYHILASYAPDGNIIVGPHLSEYCLRNNIYTDDYGQAECMSQRALDIYHSEHWYSVVFPYLDDMLGVNIAYEQNVQQKVNNGEYDVIAINDKGGSQALNRLTINENQYYKLKSIDLQTGTQVWTTHFYIKK